MVAPKLHYFSEGAKPNDGAEEFLLAVSWNGDLESAVLDATYFEMPVAEGYNHQRKAVPFKSCLWTSWRRLSLTIVGTRMLN